MTIRYRPRRAQRHLSAERWGYLRAGLYPLNPPLAPFADDDEAAAAYHDVREELLDRFPVDERGPWAFWTFERGIPAELRALPQDWDDRGPALAARRTWLDGGAAA